MRYYNSHKENKGKYSVDDLLQDNNFIASQLCPSEESDTYWTELLEKEDVNVEDYAFACGFIRAAQIRSESISDSEILNLWVDIEVANKTKMRRRKRHFHLISVVSGLIALLAIVLLLSGIVSDRAGDFPLLFTAKTQHIAGADILLYLEDSDQPVSFEGKKDAKITYNDRIIVINDHDTVLSKELPAGKKQAFHQLVVPWGKRSILTLGEGSRIWVNAGTRIVYPANFDKKKREIYVDGEIYIEVSPDEKRPFIIKTTKMDVEVLGTAFNLTAYEQDETQRIVLVTGSVKIRDVCQKKEAILSPNEMYSFSNGISKIQTVEVEDYILWKYGLFRYSSESLESIMKQLSRYYGCSITCSPQVSQMKFSGKLDMKDSLDDILEGISRTSPISYRYDQGKYIITNK